MATGKVYLPCIPLGVWHYAVAVRKDNTIGEETYNRWCPPAGGGPRIYNGHMGEDKLDGIHVLTKWDDQPRIDAPETVDDDVQIVTEMPAPQQQPFQQTINTPFVFNFTQYGNNNTQIGHIEHYHAGKKEE